jgi:diaminohydroxyphosphoribosylaminopyrimidine deaminase/5-amino-6-(5-phosphoribosylamino)uracil reductase
VFLRYSKTGKPFVVLKVAMTLDGQIATEAGESKWITSEESRGLVHQFRDRYDAVLVGINTVIKDNPHLTCRIPGGRDPLRIILDSRLRIPLNANVLKDRNVLIVTTGKHSRRKVRELKEKAEVWIIGKEKVGLGELMRKLGEKEITSVLIEGGAKINYSAVKAGIVDKYLFFIAPKLMLGRNTSAFKGKGVKKLNKAVEVTITSVRTVGCDLMVEAYPTN